MGWLGWLHRDIAESCLKSVRLLADEKLKSLVTATSLKQVRYKAADVGRHLRVRLAMDIAGCLVPV